MRRAYFSNRSAWFYPSLTHQKIRRQLSTLPHLQQYHPPNFSSIPKDPLEAGKVTFSDHLCSSVHYKDGYRIKSLLNWNCCWRAFFLLDLLLFIASFLFAVVLKVTLPSNMSCSLFHLSRYKHRWCFDFFFLLVVRRVITLPLLRKSPCSLLTILFLHF